MSRRPRRADSSSRSSPSSRRGKGSKNLPLAGIVLLIVGAILLLQTTGALPWDMWLGLWRFWPLLVIALGINILFGRRIGWWATVLVVAAILIAIGWALLLGPGDEKPVSSVAEPLNGIQSTDVNIKFGAGDLKVGSLPGGSPNLVEGQFGTEGHGARVQLVRSQNTGKLTISPNRQPWIRWFWFSKASWDISLSQTLRLTMDLDVGAAAAKLDLQELKLSPMNVNVGAADVEIVMPASAGDVKANINAGAADITIVIPQGVAAKIKKHAGVSSFAIDSGRFPLSGDVYVSPDFESAKNRVTVDLEIGAANVTIK